VPDGWQRAVPRGNAGAGHGSTTAFYRSALYPLLSRINAYLVRWDPQEVQTAAVQEEGHEVLAGNHREISQHVRALEMGSFGPARLVTRMIRAR
jgi:hypothetical protein